MSADKEKDDSDFDLKNLEDELSKINSELADGIRSFKEAVNRINQDRTENMKAIEESKNKIRLLSEFMERSHDESIKRLTQLAGDDPDLLDKVEQYKSIIGYIDPSKRKMQ